MNDYDYLHLILLDKSVVMSSNKYNSNHYYDFSNYCYYKIIVIIILRIRVRSLITVNECN